MHSTTRRTPALKHLAAVMALAGLAACGGGGDDRASYTLGGSVGGLATGQSVALANSGGEEVAVAANGAFTFARPLADGSTYAVAVKTAPAGAGCVVRNGAGTVAAAAVDSVAVRCAPLATLADGMWEQDRCRPSADGGSVRTLWSFNTPANGPLAAGVGSVNYRNAQCDGVGVAVSGPLSGTFWFEQERTENGAGLAAFWGKRQTFPGGLLNPAVFTLVVLVRKANHLCLLEDTAVPSAFPNAASLEPSVTAAIAAGNCHTPR